MNIGGACGTGDGLMILKPLVYTIFTREMLTKITWTGQNDKIPLKSYANIIKLIHTLCKKSDRNCSDSQLEQHLIYKIIKYAPKK